MPSWLEHALGALLILLVLADVFLTVLYARTGTGIISDRLARQTWSGFRAASKPFGRHRGVILTLCGPVILVPVVTVWAMALTLGAGLIIHPLLGTDVRASNGETPTDFVTALYAGGSSMALVGASDFTPHTGPSRFLFLLNSLIGASVLSLSLTYLLQVYTALKQRNALGMNVYLATAETGDAAELVARLGPKGRFDGGYSNLAELAVQMTEVKEAHHFYPVLFFFRFSDPHYSVSHVALVSLDTVTLIESALDDERYAWLKASVSVDQLRRASMRLVTTLQDTFLSGGVRAQQRPPDEQTRDHWRRRYVAAVRRLQQAGIQTTADEQAGAETYVSLRAHWDRHIATLVPALAYDMEEIDPAGRAPEPNDEQQAIRTAVSD